jgi:hypothetical protein
VTQRLLIAAGLLFASIVVYAGTMTVPLSNHKGIFATAPAEEGGGGGEILAYSDDFDVGAGGNQQLNLRVPDVGGGSYIETTGHAGGILHDQTNGVVKSSSTSNGTTRDGFWTNSFGTSVWTATCTLRAGVAASSNRAGFWFSASTATLSNPTGFVFRQQGDDNWQLTREDAGGASTVHLSSTVAVDNTAFVPVNVTHNGSGFYTLYINGVFFDDFTDATYISQNQFGMRVRNNGQIDSVVVDDIP